MAVCAGWAGDNTDYMHLKSPKDCEHLVTGFDLQVALWLFGGGEEQGV